METLPLKKGEVGGKVEVGEMLRRGGKEKNGAVDA